MRYGDDSGRSGPSDGTDAADGRGAPTGSGSETGTGAAAGDAIGTGKAALRAELLAARATLPPTAREAAATALAARALELPELSGADTVAAYVSMGREPGTRALLDALRARGVRVILPVLMHDNDLDWAVYEGPERLAGAARGLLEPVGGRLGPDAVLRARAVLLPGLAVDRRGMRLGRGGGSYDRVLARLADAGASPTLVVLLYDGEVLPRVPAEAHDRPVGAAVTPGALHRFGPAAG
ncbi:5-formyltetrahydrofolate cyclo-ligase [Streptomyces fuscigenes]|uniref:5-formyltetrahydrofolate cyclo-ligase n=1 Tax=Streptomyces fuscigenes TaxID=1528880 RepID=UPI001F1BC771|nr:5-formyltetrahydrofolate cyclo-ligase [Streptomyces fuscigenes]MCF3962093.1 5-formyltetrahydrofolate cyclo-ligase [Streptomyces fuscigenes]